MGATEITRAAEANAPIVRGRHDLAPAVKVTRERCGSNVLLEQR